MRIKMSWIRGMKYPIGARLRRLEFCGSVTRAFRRKYKGRKEVTLDEMLDFCTAILDEDWVLYQVVRGIPLRQLKKHKIAIMKYLSGADFYSAKRCIDKRIKDNK